MPHEATAPAERPNLGLGAIPAQWRQPLLQLGLAWFGIVVLTAQEWIEMVDQWWNSSTYNHILLIPVILGWLVYARFSALKNLTPSGWLLGLGWVAGAVLLWLLSRFAAFNLGAHLATVLMLQGAVLAVLGPRVSTALLFPLAYMLFLVPFGDELVPALQMITAKLTIWLTEFSGIPAVIEGVFIDTPAGLFEVAEACSGVKFLVAMVALGTLVSHVAFSSWKRRAAFMALAIIVPIIANGIRAWGTIYIAQFAGVEFAAGFDHIFYGWIFFALVMALVLAIGWRFFDKPADAEAVDIEPIRNSVLLDKLASFSLGNWRAILGIAGMLVLAFVWHLAASNMTAKLPPQIYAPQINGWEQVDYKPSVWWEPRAAGADHRLLTRYRNEQGQEVDVFFAAYANQQTGKEAGAFGEGALVPDTEWRWLSAGPELQDAQTDVLQAFGRVQRTTATSYRAGSTLTGSTAKLKLAVMRDKLLVRSTPTSKLIIASEKTELNPDPAAALVSFREATGDVGAFMDALVQPD